jgi:cytochrome c oxidase assembly protein subunit 15
MSRSTRGVHRLAVLTTVATAFLIFAGGMVTSTGSGLAVPDWPLSFGTLFPPMVGGVFYEHGHRMVAGVVALLTAVLALAAWRRDPRRRVRWLAVAAVILVVVQALLGGLTVLLLLPVAVSVTHAGVANVFFVMTLTLAFLTRPDVVDPTPPPAGMYSPGDLRTGWIALTLAVYGQILLGAVMRHSGAGLAIPDFPLAFGRLLPPLDSWPVAIHFAHRAGALLVVVLSVMVLPRTLARAQSCPRVGQPAVALTGLIPLQVFLGALTIWSQKAPLIASLHVVVGTIGLGAAFWTTLEIVRVDLSTVRRMTRATADSTTRRGAG